jgi:Protein of unknown function (DUF3667)
MSHSKERNQKDCLNCGAQVLGRYCHVCGQENREPRETVWALVTHYFYDLFHFDSKFFSSLWLLFRRPGFLPAEYLKGKRETYLNPIKMYVFTSAFFFIIFFSFIYQEGIKNDAIIINETPETTGPRVTLRQDSTNVADSIRDAFMAPDDSVSLNVFGVEAGEYNSMEQYDSLQKTLPVLKRDGFIKSYVIRKTIKAQGRFREEGVSYWKRLFDRAMHRLPQVLFLSLPFFAFFLWILYLEKKPNYYVDHWIFALFQYIFSFISLLIVFSLNALERIIQWRILDLIGGVILLYTFYYLYKSMRYFYGQSRTKTIFKYITLSFLMFITMIILMAGLFGYTLIET